MAVDGKFVPYGKIENIDQIGLAIRTKRRAIGMLQSELAALSGVGTRFLSELENGKATAEIGLVLRVLRRLGLDLYVRPRGLDSRADGR
jgi:HTH-type transcriptional regulator / antitoxin HipB